MEHAGWWGEDVISIVEGKHIMSSRITVRVRVRV